MARQQSALQKPDSSFVSPLSKKRRGPQLPSGWQNRFLTAYRKIGTRWVAARQAEVSHDTVTAEEARNPTFAAQVEDARQEHADYIELNLRRLAVKKDNVIANIVLAKKHRPEDFIERKQELHLHAHTMLDDGAGRSLLASMLASSTDSTRASLTAHIPHSAAQVVDVTPVDEDRVLSKNADTPS